MKISMIVKLLEYIILIVVKRMYSKVIDILNMEFMTLVTIQEKELLTL